MNVETLLRTKTADVITISVDATVQDAIVRLAEFNIGAIVIVDAQDNLVGIFSERDFVRAAARRSHLLTAPIHTVMTPDVITGRLQDDLTSVADRMTKYRIRHLPIVENGRLVGMVSIGDVLKAQRDTFQNEAEVLELQVMKED